MNDFFTLAKLYGTDKSLHYAGLYDELFRDRRQSIKKVLEIGIGSPETMLSSVARMGQRKYTAGASLFMWREYFPNAVIYGLDNDPRILISEDRIKSFYLDQSDPCSYEVIWKRIGDDFDVVVDDGSHVPAHQMLSFEKLFPLVKSGGIYVIEDCSMDKPLDIPVPHETRDFWHNPLDPARVVVIRK